MSDKWVLTLHLRKPLMSQNDQRRAHWTQVAKAKEQTEAHVAEAVSKAKLKKIEFPVTVRVIWYAPDARRRDPDSIAVMVKGVLDSLVKLGILEDDSSKFVHDVRLGPIVIARDNPRFEVVIKKVMEEVEE